MRPTDDMGGVPAARSNSQEIAATADYAALRDAIVERATAARECAARAVNTELVLLYWSIGRTILTEQERHAWGDDVVGLLAQDLRAHGDVGRGFSRRNLFYMRKFAALWPNEQIVQPLAAQIGWTHHQVLLDAFGDAPDLYAWYAARAIENRWSRRQLRGQIDLKLHLRTGAATANYAATLGDIDGHAALAVTYACPRRRRPTPFLPGLCVALDLDRPRLGERRRELLALMSSAAVDGDILRTATVDAQGGWCARATRRLLPCCPRRRPSWAIRRRALKL